MVRLVRVSCVFYFGAVRDWNWGFLKLGVRRNVRRDIR